MTSSVTLAAAHQQLKQFDCLQPNAPILNDYPQLQAALQVVVQHSDYQILGICADTLEQGTKALKSYVDILGYQVQPNFQPLEEAVYIKFNPRSGLCYASPYEGSYRGVLVSCQSAYETGVNEIYGYLPLDLFG